MWIRVLNLDKRFCNIGQEFLWVEIRIMVKVWNMIDQDLEDGKEYIVKNKVWNK